MENMLRAFYAKPLIICLIVMLVFISTLAGTADAMFLSTGPDHGTGAAALSSGRSEDMVRIQKALESKIIGQKLADYGLTPDEVMARMNTLSDAQIHQLAVNSDSVQAGGDAIGFVAGAIVVGLLVVLLIYLVQGKIQIK